MGYKNGKRLGVESCLVMKQNDKKLLKNHGGSKCGMQT